MLRVFLVVTVSVTAVGLYFVMPTRLRCIKSLFRSAVFISYFGLSLAARGQELVAPEIGLPQPEALLTQLSVSLRENSYYGDFTYEHDSTLETYRLYHHVDGDARVDMLYRLTGPDQSFSRRGISACGTLGSLLLGGGRLTSTGGEQFSLFRNYKPVLLGRDRIADRSAWVVQLVPLDEYRLGMTLAISEIDNLLLRYVIYDATKKMGLERMQFVSLHPLAGDQLPEIMESSRHAEVDSQQCVGSSFHSEAKSPWRPTWVPNGFILAGYQYSERDGHMETYTDGLASFSIFVRRDAEKKMSRSRVQRAVSARGASIALISAVPYLGQTVFVTIVGEIPLQAAQKVSLSMREAVVSSG